MLKTLTSFWMQSKSVIPGLLGILTLFMSVWFLSQEKPGVAGTGFAAGGFMLFLSMLDRFEVLEWLGLKTKMRDLQRDIDEGAELLKKIHSVAAAFAPSMLEFTSRVGRWSGPPPAEVTYRLSQHVREILKDAGQTEQQIRETLAPWANIVARDVYAAAQEEFKRREAQLKRDWPMPISDLEGYNKAIAAKNDRSDLLKLLQDHPGYTPTKYAELLEATAKDLPNWVEQQVASAFHAHVQAWGPELRYLDEHQEFRVPLHWFEALKHEMK